MSFIIPDDFSLPSNSSLSLNGIQCLGSPVGTYALVAVIIAYILLILPTTIFVLYLGFRQWTQQQSVTHSDFFNYNMAVIELIGAFGYAVYYYSNYTHLAAITTFSMFICSFIWPAQTLFPILTCVEHYLAVVHPITYRGLRQAGGVRIRNITTGCIWLLCFLWGALVILLYEQFYRRLIGAFVLILSLIAIVFFSLSILRVLIRPRPAKVGGNSGQVDQSKQRAIRTILIIMAVLWFKFCGNVVTIVFKFSTQLSVRCAAESLAFVVFLPSNLVLPLLFLQRAGKLPKCFLR